MRVAKSTIGGPVVVSILHALPQTASLSRDSGTLRAASLYDIACVLTCYVHMSVAVVCKL
jgi:hypothetical protein